MNKTLTIPFQVGDAVEHRGVVIAPLFPTRNPACAYITLDEALPQGLAITETSESGDVPELAVHNPLGTNVLLYDGEELVGAKQNRILNVTVLVGAESDLRIPVSCVEQGRWSARSAAMRSAGHVSHAHLRRRKAEMLAAMPLERGLAQGEVWDEVRAKAGRMGTFSPTGAASDTFYAHRDQLDELEHAFPLVPGQCGALLALGDSLCARLGLAPGCLRTAVAEAPPRLSARRSRDTRWPDRRRKRRSPVSLKASVRRPPRASRRSDLATTCGSAASERSAPGSS